MEPTDEECQWQSDEEDDENEDKEEKKEEKKERGRKKRGKFYTADCKLDVLIICHVEINLCAVTILQA